jgi:hypothetical protein
VLSPALIVRRRIVRGVLSGNRRWLILGGVLWGGGKVRRVFGRHAETLMLPKLSPGQSVGLTVGKPPTRRQRRAARRAS